MQLLSTMYVKIKFRISGGTGWPQLDVPGIILVGIVLSNIRLKSWDGHDIDQIILKLKTRKRGQDRIAA